MARYREDFKISVVVPTYNRPETLADCLEALSQQDFPPQDFEVIVVDDGSKISPEKIVASRERQLSVSLIQHKHSGPAGARNLGAAHARGRFLAFTDDDCRPHPQWLKSMATHLDATPHAAFGGRIVNGLPRNPFSTASQLLLDYLYRYYHNRRLPTRFFATMNLALAKEPFLKIGGFDSQFAGLAGAEDREFSVRWLSKGYPLIYASEAMVYHAHPLNPLTFWRQHFTYGRGALLFHRLRRNYASEGFWIEPLSFYLEMFRYPFPEKGLGPGFLLAGLLFIAQLANALGFFWEGAIEIFSRQNSRGS